MYKIQRVALRGFRGYPDSGAEEPFKFRFSDSLNLVYGPNRAGKSSLLSSLEWLLFGSRAITRIGDSEIPRQRKNWQIAHREAGRTEVKVRFKSEEDRLEVFREEGKDPVVDGDPTADLPGRFGVTKRDYFATVHLHQQTVHNLLTATPKERKTIFYSLLGLSELEEAREALKAWSRYSYSTQMQEELDERIDSRRGNIDQLEKEMEETLADADFEKEDCSEKAVVARCETLEEELTQFCAEAGLEEPKLGDYREREERQNFFSRVKKSINRLRTENPAQARLDTIDDLQARVTALAREIENHGERVRGLEESLDEIAGKTDGEGKSLYSEDEITEREELLERIDAFLGSAESAREEQLRIWEEESKRAELIEKAEEYLQEVGGLGRCPVCGNSTSREEISEHLEAHSKTLSDQARSAKDRVQELQELLREAERDRQRAQSDLEKLRKGRSEGRLHLQAKLTDLEREVKERLPTDEFGLPSITDDSILPRVLARLESQLEEFREKVTEEAKRKQKTLNSYQSELEQTRNMQFVLVEKAKIKHLQDYRNSEPYRRADELISRQAGREYEMAVLSEAIARTRQELVSSRLEEARQGINRFFGRIADRNYFGGIAVDDDLNLYSTEDGEEIDLRGIHNQGDLNAAALSLFLGMGIGDQIGHRLGFIILDDPIQSLDLGHQQGFIRILEEISGEKQVVLATHDERVFDEMKNLTVPVNVIELSDWDAKAGPRIDIRELK